MILSINFAIVIFLSCLSNFLKHFRVGTCRYENLFIFFWKAIKIAGSAQKTGSVGLAETQVFLGLIISTSYIFLGLKYRVRHQRLIAEFCSK